MAIVHPGTGTDPLRTVYTQPITPGIITASIIYCTSDNREPYAVYAQSGIAANNDTGPVSAAIVLAEGYVSVNRPQSWSGIYIMKPGDHFFLVLTGDLTQSIFADVRRLPNIARKTLEEIFAATLSPS